MARGNTAVARYPVLNLGQVRPAPGGPAPSCPAIPPSDPSLNCMRTREGGVICSDGIFYPKGCPAPEITEEGIALYDQSSGRRIPIPPPVRASLEKEVGPGFPWIAVAIAAAGGIAAILF